MALFLLHSGNDLNKLLVLLCMTKMGVRQTKRNCNKEPNKFSKTYML